MCFSLSLNLHVPPPPPPPLPPSSNITVLLNDKFKTSVWRESEMRWNTCSRHWRRFPPPSINTKMSVQDRNISETGTSARLSPLVATWCLGHLEALGPAAVSQFRTGTAARGHTDDSILSLETHSLLLPPVIYSRELRELDLVWW